MTVAPIAARAAAGGAAGTSGATAGARAGTAAPGVAGGASIPGRFARFARRLATGNRPRPAATRTSSTTTRTTTLPVQQPAPQAAPTRTGTPARGNGLAGGFARGEQRFDRAAGEASSKITLTPPRRITASDGAGFLAGLFLYALALNYLRDGREGVKGWLGAKFVNRPYVADTTIGDGAPRVGGRGSAPVDGSPADTTGDLIGGGVAGAFGRRVAVPVESANLGQDDDQGGGES